MEPPCTRLMQEAALRAGEQVGQLQRPPHSCAGQQGCTGSLWPHVPCSLPPLPQVLQKDPKNEALDSPMGALRVPEAGPTPVPGGGSWVLLQGAEQSRVGVEEEKGLDLGGALSCGPALSRHLLQQVLG